MMKAVRFLGQLRALMAELIEMIHSLELVALRIGLLIMAIWAIVNTISNH